MPFGGRDTKNSGEGDRVLKDDWLIGDNAAKRELRVLRV